MSSHLVEYLKWWKLRAESRVTKNTTFLLNSNKGKCSELLPRSVRTMSGSPVVTCLGQEGLKLKKNPFHESAYCRVITNFLTS